MEPYWSDPDGDVQLYLGDMRQTLPALGITADLIVADPPYGETSLAWDRWPDGWPTLAAQYTRSMWCFGSMRMFLQQVPQFDDWKLSQDIVWRKNAGSGFAADRFKRIHEFALHWYRGGWAEVHHETVREVHHGRKEGVVTRTVHSGMHTGGIGKQDWIDDGTRIATSVIDANNLRGRAIHPTEKPLGLLDPLIRYACPPGGLVLDPFAGSGSTLDAARQSGRRAVGIEANEQYAEAAALRLSALVIC